MEKELDSCLELPGGNIYALCLDVRFTRRVFGENEIYVESHCSKRKPGDSVISLLPPPTYVTPHRHN